MKNKSKKRKSAMAKYCMITPISLWMYLLVAIPFIYIIVISFMNKGTYGGVTPGFTVNNYLSILNPLYIYTFLKSIGMSVACLLYTSPVFLSFNITVRMERGSPRALFAILEPYHFIPIKSNGPPM